MQTRRKFLFRSLAVSAVAFGISAAAALRSIGIKPAVAAAGKAVMENGRMLLPKPEKNGGLPFMQTLAKRKSTRRFQAKALSDQQLSNLLWATWGVNRDDGRRTAPTAMNQQNVAVLAVMPTGVWLYDGDAHALDKKLDTDLTKAFGGAPLTLVYAAEEGPYAGMHLGSLYQNAGLFCASTGLGNVVKASGVDVLQAKEHFSALGLPAGYRIMIVQSVGLVA